jgi:hypothetical protein
MHFHRTRVPSITVIAAGLLAFPSVSSAAVASTPPMGWNSYDSFDDSVKESEVLAQAQVVKEALLEFGWSYVIVDFRWYDPNAPASDQNSLTNPLTMDANGRLLPAVNRFPSATGSNGFKPLADQIHAMGLKFGIHIMRGIPRQAEQANSSILGSAFHAQDAADTVNVCTWNRDMYGVKGDTAAGQAYYDSIFQLYAAWGIDFVKVDDMIRNIAPINYHRAEVEAIRKAIDKTGRPIVLSLSPGEMQPSDAAHLAANANMWRMANDFWDNWSQLDYAFTLADRWKMVAGPGHWPDEDMLPIGHLGPRAPVGGANRSTNFTQTEQTTMLSLWALLPSPLMLGNNLTQMDAFTTSLLTNEGMIVIDQDPMGAAGKRLRQQGSQEVWVKPMSDGGLAVGLFNRGATAATISVTFAELGLTGGYRVSDVWQKNDMGIGMGPLSASVPSHGAALFRVAPSVPPRAEDAGMSSDASETEGSINEASVMGTGGGEVGTSNDDASGGQPVETSKTGGGGNATNPMAGAPAGSSEGCACELTGRRASANALWTLAIATIVVSRIGRRRSRQHRQGRPVGAMKI